MENGQIPRQGGARRFRRRSNPEGEGRSRCETFSVSSRNPKRQRSSTRCGSDRFTRRRSGIGRTGRSRSPRRSTTGRSSPSATALLRQDLRTREGLRVLVRQVQADEAPRRRLREVRRRGDPLQGPPRAHGSHRSGDSGRAHLVPQEPALRIGNLLDITLTNLEKVLYCESYIVIDPKDSGLQEREILTEDRYDQLLDELRVDSFRAGMGAEAIKELQGADRRGRGSGAAALRCATETSEAKRKKRQSAKRLKVIEAFRESAATSPSG